MAGKLTRGKHTHAQVSQASRSQLLKSWDPTYKKSNEVSSTCLALWAVSMPWFLRQLTALGSGDRPTFQSETAPLSMTHCNTKHTSAPSSPSTVPAGQCDSWGHRASSCSSALGNQEGFLAHTWMSLRCLSSTAGEKKIFFRHFLPRTH